MPLENLTPAANPLMKQKSNSPQIAQNPSSPATQPKKKDQNLFLQQNENGEPLTEMEQVFREKLQRRTITQQTNINMDSGIQQCVVKQIQHSKTKLSLPNKPKQEDYHGLLEYKTQKRGFDRQQKRINLAN